MDKKTWELIGWFSVDSGQIIIVDPCYLNDFKNNANEFEKLVKEDGSGDKDFSYCGCCNATLSKQGGGQLYNGVFNIAVAIETGYGDGVYPVYVKRDENGRIVRVLIKFD